ncbi:MAG: hypothetical protein ACKOF9_07840 [Burkholderiales bacterium]
MFPLTLHFHDSEVKHILQEQRRLRVVFSAARVQTAARVACAFDGYALGLELQLVGVLGQPTVFEGFGRLSSGSISVGGPPRSTLLLPSLPFEWEGNTQLRLRFSQEGIWTASALSACLCWENGERLSPALSC